VYGGRYHDSSKGKREAYGKIIERSEGRKFKYVLDDWCLTIISLQTVILCGKRKHPSISVGQWLYTVIFYPSSQT
jgi:hypothetical protein